MYCKKYLAQSNMLPYRLKDIDIVHKCLLVIAYIRFFSVCSLTRGLGHEVITHMNSKIIKILTIIMLHTTTKVSP